jgi:hypothetical protein
MKKFDRDMWASGKATQLNFQSAMSAGQHVLEIYGAESCCDGTTSKTFRVNGGKWMAISTANLDNQV